MITTRAPDGANKQEVKFVGLKFKDSDFQMIRTLSKIQCP